MIYMAIGVGGIIGAVLRFLITCVFTNYGNYFPIGILFINVLGCFLLGYLQGTSKFHNYPDWVIMGIGTGFLGAFTTFSTFSMEVIYFLNKGEILFSIFYILMSSFGGYFLVYIGFSLAQIRGKGV